MNHIEKKRADIQACFDPQKIISESRETFYSPDKKYKIETVDFLQNDPTRNWTVKRVELFYEITGTLLQRFFLDDDHFFHAWVTKDDVDYLLCAEELCGGQTVIDLTNNQLFSYSSGDDGFIWAEYFLSPNKKIVAIIGCYWACPYVIKLFSFEHPTQLPLPEIKELSLTDNAEIFVEWHDDQTIKLRNDKGIERLQSIQ